MAFSQENDGRSERVQTNLLFVWVSDATVARAPSAVTRSVLLPSLPEEGFRAQSVPFVQIHKFDTFCLQSELPLHKGAFLFPCFVQMILNETALLLLEKMTQELDAANRLRFAVICADSWQ